MFLNYKLEKFDLNNGNFGLKKLKLRSILGFSSIFENLKSISDVGWIKQRGSALCSIRCDFAPGP